LGLQSAPIPLGYQTIWQSAALDSSALSLRDKSKAKDKGNSVPELLSHLSCAISRPTFFDFITHRTASLLLSTRDSNSFFCQINHIKRQSSIIDCHLVKPQGIAHTGERQHSASRHSPKRTTAHHGTNLDARYAHGRSQRRSNEETDPILVSFP